MPFVSFKKRKLMDGLNSIIKIIGLKFNKKKYWGTKIAHWL